MARLTYRLFEENDAPAVAALWERETDWGRIEASRLETLLRTPAGEGILALAIEDDGTRRGRVVGQLMFLPTAVCVDGEVVRAVRPAAAIVAADVRDGLHSADVVEFGHPVVALYALAVEEAQTRGARLVHALPNPGVLRFFELIGGGGIQLFPLWSRGLASGDPAERLPAGTTARLVTSYGDPIQELWEASARVWPCQVRRTPRDLDYKAAVRSVTPVLIERSGSPLAFAAGRPFGDRQWLVYDLLVRDAAESLRAALVASVQAAHEHRAAAETDKPIEKVGILATPAMEPVLAALGFARDNYDFPLVVHVLDPLLDPACVAPERWYVSAND